MEHVARGSADGHVVQRAVGAGLVLAAAAPLLLLEAGATGLDAGLRAVGGCFLGARASFSSTRRSFTRRSAELNLRRRGVALLVGSLPPRGLLSRPKGHQDGGGLGLPRKGHRQQGPAARCAHRTVPSLGLQGDELQETTSAPAASRWEARRPRAAGSSPACAPRSPPAGPKARPSTVPAPCLGGRQGAPGGTRRPPGR